MNMHIKYQKPFSNIIRIDTDRIEVRETTIEDREMKIEK
jgi:hypothetical protein